MRKDWIKGLIKVDFGFGANMLMVAAATAILSSVAFDILDREKDNNHTDTDQELEIINRKLDRMYEIVSKKGDKVNE